MKLVSAVSMLSLMAPVAPAVAQQTTPSSPQTSTPQAESESSTDSSLPESMRIQQSVTQQNARDPAMPHNGALRPVTDAPGSAGAPLETNRIDPAAPSRQRLQIDDGASAAVRQNPDADTLHPGSAGASYNTILRGAPSTTGAGMGTTGVGSSGSETFGASRSGSSRAGASGSSGIGSSSSHSSSSGGSR